MLQLEKIKQQHGKYYVWVGGMLLSARDAALLLKILMLLGETSW